MKELKIDRTIRELIPPLTSQEYSDLEDSIVKGGCRHPIVVWAGKDIIIDGHNRYDICVKNKVEFKVEEIEFATKKDALIWMYDTQLGRRNLNDAQKVELALRREQLIGGNISTTKALSREARDEIAEVAQVSDRTVAKVKAVLEEGSKKTKKAMREGKVSIDKAYKETRHIEPKETAPINVNEHVITTTTMIPEGHHACPKCNGKGYLKDEANPIDGRCSLCGGKVFIDGKCKMCGASLKGGK
jgi:hypothetical protein